MTDVQGFERHIVFGKFEFFVGNLPAEMAQRATDDFELYWDLHPAEHHMVRQPVRGALIPIPRWQQAYERDYRFTGSVNAALPLPPVLYPYVAYARTEVDERLNGILLNWYDAAQGHYIGPHRDSRSGLIPGSPIVTISLGAARGFRLSLGGEPSLEFLAHHGRVFIVPWDTNLAVKHEVPEPRKDEFGRRISITVRAFL